MLMKILLLVVYEIRVKEACMKLKKSGKQMGLTINQEKTKFMEVSPSQGHFTRHGLHMNGMGKEKMTREISETQKNCYKRERSTHHLVMEGQVYGKKWRNERKEGHFTDKGNRSPVIRKKS
jgi:hypothetical protein